MSKTITKFDIPPDKEPKRRGYSKIKLSKPKMLVKKVQSLNIGPALVHVDFATITPIDKSLSSNEHHLAYYRQLMSAEQAAKRKKLGLWYYAEPTRQLTSAVFSKMMSFVLQKRQMQLKPASTTST